MNNLTNRPRRSGPSSMSRVYFSPRRRRTAPATGPCRRARRGGQTPCVTRQEVAMRCFDTTTPEVAVARLRRWIRDDLHLRKELLAAGYCPYTHHFSPRVVEVIYKYLL